MDKKELEKKKQNLVEDINIFKEKIEEFENFEPTEERIEF